MRRTNIEMEKEFECPYEKCEKIYGSDGALNLHVKVKHHGGTKTQRDAIAKKVLAMYQGKIVESDFCVLNLNLPPGALLNAAKQLGLSESINEEAIIDEI
jgi:hypothetical protein